MKTINLKPPVRSIFLIVAIAIMILSFSSCAVKKPFLLSSVVPAARGSVTVKKDKNKNYDIKIEILNLAEASRLPREKNTYVVWMVADDNTTKNIGQIRSSSSFLLKKLKATLDTKSPVRPTKIFITAEYDANIQYPVAEIVLSTANFQE